MTHSRIDSLFPRWTARKPCSRQTRLFVGLAAAAVLASACAPTMVGVMSPSQLTRSLRNQGIDPAHVIVPYELTPEIKAWVHNAVPTAIAPDKRLDMLLALVLDPKGLNLKYSGGFTGTAAEVYASHEANCLGFTNLFVGLARELEVPAFYLNVDDLEHFSKEGDLVIEAGHVTGGFGTGDQLQVLDFTMAPVAHYRDVHSLTDTRAVALYYSNRGAETLRAGHPESSLWWLRMAVKIAPDFSGAWINLGVALRRAGDIAGAEAAYEKAIELAPSSSAAYANLAGLLRSIGRGTDADRVLSLTANVSGRDPYSYLTLGDVALSAGRLDMARSYYERANGLGKNAETLAALGELALAEGQRKSAEHWLSRARKADSSNSRVRRLAGRLSMTTSGSLALANPR
jgi:Flp pilus assembly protein TadD